MTVYCPVGSLYRSWPVFTVSNLESIGPAIDLYSSYLSVNPVLADAGLAPRTVILTLPVGVTPTGLVFQVEFGNVYINNGGLLSNYKRAVGIFTGSGSGNNRYGIWFGDVIYSGVQCRCWYERNGTLNSWSPSLSRGLHTIQATIEILNNTSSTYYNTRGTYSFTAGPLAGTTYVNNSNVDYSSSVISLGMFGNGNDFDSFGVDNSCYVNSILIYHPQLPGGSACPGFVVPDYTADFFTVYVTDTINFTDLSTSLNPITDWLWDFDDTTTSPLQNPSHSWSDAGTKNVTLTVSNSDDSRSISKDIYIRPAIPLNLAGNQIGYTTTITLTWDSAQGADIYILERDIDPLFSSPVVVYTGANNYYNDTITIITSDYYYRVKSVETVTSLESDWSATLDVSILISVTADFAGSPLLEVIPFNTQFTDLSTSLAPIISWDWDFGDGSPHSTDQNPLHMYNTIGAFTVTLTVDNSFITDTLIKYYYVEALALIVDFIGNPTSGQVNLDVQFTDISIGNFTAWEWNFGDGSVHSTEQNPSHTYNSAGNYTVTLTAYDGSYSDSETKENYIRVFNINVPQVLPNGGGFTRSYGPSLIFD